MKASEFLILLGAIYIAPHMSRWYASLWAAIFSVVGLWLAWKGH